MKLKHKPTYFTRQDLELVIEFDRLLEAELIQIQKDIEFKNALKKLSLRNSFAVFLADFKASRNK